VTFPSGRQGTGMMRLPRRDASSTSHLHSFEPADDGDRIKMTVSASRMSPPKRVLKSSPPEIPSRSMATSYLCD
jgi:hypothetical protein